MCDSQVCDSDIRCFRVLLIGPTDVGKSSIINRFIHQEPLKTDGSENEQAARTASTEGTGTGANGTTEVCRTYRVPASTETGGLVIELVDSVGIGTTREGAQGGGLLADLEEMSGLGEKVPPLRRLSRLALCLPAHLVPPRW